MQARCLPTRRDGMFLSKSSRLLHRQLEVACMFDVRIHSTFWTCDWPARRGGGCRLCLLGSGRAGLESRCPARTTQEPARALLHSVCRRSIQSRHCRTWPETARSWQITMLRRPQQWRRVVEAVHRSQPRQSRSLQAVQARSPHRRNPFRPRWRMLGLDRRLGPRVNPARQGTRAWGKEHLPEQDRPRPAQL